MDDMTNYLLTGVIYLAIWAIGALVVHYTEPDTTNYINWLKIWAIAAPFVTIGISLLLGVMFPPPELSHVDLTKLGGL